MAAHTLPSPPRSQNTDKKHKKTRARIEKVFYGTNTADVKELGHFEDEDFYLEFTKAPADRLIPAVGFMREEAKKVWEEFFLLPDKCHY